MTCRYGWTGAVLPLAWHMQIISAHTYMYTTTGYIKSKCTFHTLHKDFTYMPLHNFQYDRFPTGTYFCIVVFICRRCSFMWQMQEVTKNRDPTMHMIGRLSSWIWQTCLSSPGQLHRRTNLHRKDAVFVQCMRTACA